jgi:hypothetical protein
MSYSWSFASFEPDSLARLLGGGHERELDAFVDLVRSGSDEFRPPSDPLIARALIESGSSYEAFDARSARTADDIVFAAFSPGGFWDLLAMEADSPDGLDPTVIEELLERGGWGAMLPLLQTGRRSGEETPSACQYVVLSPEEVAILLKEVRRAMAAPTLWSAPFLPQVVVDCLIEPLEGGVREGRWVFASLG